MYEDVSLTRFQHSPGSPDDNTERIGAPQNRSSYRHKLRRICVLSPGMVDSECFSCKWLHVRNTIDWVIGTTRRYYRYKIFSNHDLDPTYTPLSELLLQLGQALEDDLHWHQTTDILYTYSEFLHEVFQRYI